MFPAIYCDCQCWFLWLTKPGLVWNLKNHVTLKPSELLSLNEKHQSSKSANISKSSTDLLWTHEA